MSDANKMTIGGWLYLIVGCGAIALVVWFVVVCVQYAMLPQEVIDDRQFVKDKSGAVADVKRYCLNTKASECQVCTKQHGRKCLVCITLKGKEIEEFVNSQQRS